MLQIHVTLESERSIFSEAFISENRIPVDELDCELESLSKCCSFFQGIDHGNSLKAAEKVSEMRLEFFSLSLEKKVFHFSNLGGEQVIMDHGMSLKAGVFHWGELVIDPGMTLKAIDKVTEEFFILSVEEKVGLTKNVYMSSLMDLNDGFSNNKDFKSATTGFYEKDDVAHFQNIKWIKCGNGGRVENIRPGRISRRRRRHNKKDKDDEDDGEDDRQPSNPHVLYLILKIVIIIKLFLIVLSLIIWLMS